MADGGGVIQFIRLMIDRGSMDKAVSDANEAGERIGAATSAAIAPQGAKAGVNYGDGFRGKILQAFDRVRDTINAALHKTEADAAKSGAKAGGSYAEGFGSGIKKIAGYLSVYLGGRALLRFGEESVKTFTDFQATLNLTQQTLANFGTRFADVRGELDKTQKSMEGVGVSAPQFYETFRRLAQITGSYNKALKATPIAINMAIDTGVTYEQAAKQIGRGADGVTTALQRTGVMIDKNRDLLTQLGEYMAGAAAARMGGFEGVLARLHVQYTNLQLVVGQYLTQQDASGKITDALSDAVKYLSGWIKDNTETIRTLSNVAADTFKGMLTSFKLITVALHYAAIGWNALGIGVSEASGYMQIFGGIVAETLSGLLKWVGKLVPGIGEVGAALDELSKKWLAAGDKRVKQAEEDNKHLLDSVPLGGIPLNKPPPLGTGHITVRKDRTTNPDTDLTKEIKLLGEGLTLQDQKVASAEKLDKIEAELNAKLAKGHMTLEQEIITRNHIKEIETARNQPNTVLEKEIGDLQNRLRVNQEDEATRARLLQIETDLEARSKLTTNSATEQYTVNKMLLDVKTALNKDTMAALENQAQLLHAMAGFQETRDEAIKRGAAMLLTIKTRLEDVNLSERERVRLLQLQNQIIADSKDPIKDTEKETKATIANVEKGRTIAERDAALAKLRELTAALQEMVKDPNNSPADVARIQAALNAAQKELDKHPIQAKGFFKDIRETLEKDLPDIAKGAAANMTDAFTNGFQMLISGAANVRTALGNIATGMAKGVAKEIAEVAKLKVQEALANAITQTAIGFGDLAMSNDKGAALAFKSAEGFLASAAKWGALAGLAGAAGGGSSGGGAAGAGAGANKTAQTVKPNGPEIHIHVDGIDPKNPRHQELAANTVQQYVERTGSTLLVGR